jgi:putative FmdB family regulatory protein
MPLYEYRCVECNRTHEVIQRFSDPDPAGCSVCGGDLERLLSAPSIRFKGSGWYINDYARKGAGSNGGSANGSGEETSKKVDKTSTTETKTDTKTPAER